MLSKVPSIFKNFFFIIGILFVVWMMFFDSNDIFNQIKKTKKYNALKKEKAYYEQNIERGERDLENLRSDKSRLERFAREKYHMKKEDEEVYIVVEKPAKK